MSMPSMSLSIRSLLLVVALIAADAAAVQADPADVGTLDGIIAAYYEVVSGPAGGVVDTARDRSLHHPDAQVAIIRTGDDGVRRVDVMTLEDYHGANAPRAAPFYEYETDRSVRRSGDLVHVWSHYAYASEPGGTPTHGGVNSITLHHDGDRYWILNWSFDADAGPSVE
ncbi:MAG: hypothetical protein V2I63_09600 [Pseudomonadales bacterium]|jgi:hypothetical protein|nr:hypothetical protein [Pseudomonadales bacterium]